MILTDEQVQEIADKILRAQDGRTVSAAMCEAIRATELAVLERLREPDWRAYAYARLGATRDGMADDDVAAVQRFLEGDA